MAHIQITDNDPRETYSPGSPQATFTIPFAFFDPTDIRVIVGGNDAVYAVTPLTSLQFSVAGSAVDGGYQGGSITLGATVSGVDVIVYRDVPDTRTTDFPYPSNTLNIKELNTQLDKVFALFQQIGRDIGRTVKLAVSSTLESINLPVPEAAKLLRWNASEDGLENVDVTGFGSLSLPLSLAQGGTGSAYANVAALFNAIKQAATEAATGVLKIATQALVNAGTNDTDAVTALKLWNAKLRGGWRNIVGRCGGFEVWSRGASVAVAAATNAYTADGWNLATNVSQNHTVSRQAGLRDGSQYSARVQRDAGQTGTGTAIFQMALDTDELLRLRNKSCMLRFTAIAGANWSPASGTLNYAVFTGTGAGPARRSAPYTGESSAMAGSINLTPGGAAVDVASVLTTLGASITQATVFYTWNPTGTAGANDWFGIDDVHIEEAPVIPDFERRPVEDEQRACRRHLAVLGGEATNVPIGSGYARSTTVARIFVPFETRMRTPPTGITVANAANFRLVRAATTVAASSIAFVQASTDGAFIDVTVASGLTAGEGLLLETNNTNCQIVFTGAEI